MSALRGVWDSAWAELPEPVHLVFSKHRKPLKAVVTGMFPTAFAELDARLRTYRQMTRNPALDDVDDALVREAVRRLTPQLTHAALNYARLEEALEGDDLGMSNRLETLSRFAWKVTSEHGPVDVDTAKGLLAKEYPPAATLRNLQRALDDREVVAEVEAALAGVAPRAAPASDPGEVLAPFVSTILSSSTLAALERSTDPVELASAERQAWASLIAHPDLGEIHGVARALWLAHQVPVPVPGLTEPSPRPLEPPPHPDAKPTMAPPRALEQSLVDRLRRPLDTDRDQLVHITPRQVLLDEVHRCVAPLGLASPGAQAIFAVVRQLGYEVGRAPSSARRPEGLAAAALPDTPVGRSFVRAVSRVRAAKANTRGYARASHDVLSTLDDPTIRFAQELWGRAHGHDVRSSLDFTDLAEVFSQLFLGVRETMFRRLDEPGNGDVLWHESDLPDRGVASETDRWVATYAAPTRADALPAFLAAVGRIAADGTATYAEVREFVQNADDDPAYSDTWDRWRAVCDAPDWLTYAMVVAVLPLMRQDVDDADDELGDDEGRD